MVFDPDGYALARAAGSGAAGSGAAGRSGWRAVFGGFAGFYRDRLGWLALGVTAVMLTYAGGLVMFWFHAVELGESGPAISWYAHWLLDSTVGFLALTPVLAVLIPFAVWVSVAVAGPRRTRILPWLYAVLAGGLFSLVTMPGPVAHDRFVGRGTWLADTVTKLVGDPDAPLAPAQDYGLAAALTQQLGAGIAVYLALTVAAMLLVRAIVVARRRIGMWMRPVSGRVTIDP